MNAAQLGPLQAQRLLYSQDCPRRASNAPRVSGSVEILTQLYAVAPWHSNSLHEARISLAARYILCVCIVILQSSIKNTRVSPLLIAADWGTEVGIA